MTLSAAKGLIRRIKARNPDSKAHVYEGYSGRGMYGEKTTGVVCSRYEYDFDKTKHRYDNLGLDMIVY